jgi:hypothetical protein
MDGSVLANLFRQQDRCGDEKTGGRIGSERVSRDLLADELVIRNIGVEGTDDIVAVGKGVGTLGIHLEAMRVGVADDIEPVLRPALAVMGTGEESLDDLAHRGVRVSNRSYLECREFLRCRRQSDQVEAKAAEKGPGVRRGRAMQAVCGKSGADEIIHRGILRSWQERLVAPVVGRVLERDRIDSIGPHRAFVDPGGEDGDLLV